MALKDLNIQQAYIRVGEAKVLNERGERKIADARVCSNIIKLLDDNQLLTPEIMALVENRARDLMQEGMKLSEEASKKIQ